VTVYKPGISGLGDVSAYQVSAKPFVSGGINVAVASASGPLEIAFPTVTRWILIRNLDNASAANTVEVAASSTGFKNDNFFSVNYDYTGTPFLRKARTPRLEMKITKLYLTGSSTNVDVIAGLSDISVNELPNNWSGSAGVG
tara:strand:+ start:5125 stop:5550 length:426 start_codon:yes stop_codon:yes gene_type:complete